MRICFIIRRLDRGGAERQLLSLVKGLPKGEFEVTVLEFYEGGGLVPELLQVPGVRRVCLNKGNRWHMLGFLRNFIRELRSCDPDIIHGYLYVANILAICSRPFLRRRPKVVMGFRSSNTHLEHYDWAASICSWLERGLSPFADLMIANSHAGAAYSRNVGYRPKKLAVISNGIDTQQFAPSEELRVAMRKVWSIESNQVLIGITGRFDRKKNHPLFLRAAALYSKENPQVRFVCIGGGYFGDYPNELQKLSVELGLKERIVWAGETQEMRSAYCALDINTLCSNAAEGFPNVLAEAMACGVPCVATNAGDASIILGDAGMVLQDSTPDAIVQAWKDMLKRDRKTLADACRRRITENFSIETLAERTATELRGLTWESA